MKPLPINDKRITRRLLYVCVAVLFVVTLLLILVEPANAAPITLTDNQELRGGTYGTVYVTGMGVGIVDCTIRRLVARGVLDLGIVGCTIGSASISGQNVGISYCDTGALTLRGELFFLDGLNMTGPLVINANHVRVNSINMRFRERTGISLISGRGHDVRVCGFMGWGGYSLVGRVGVDWDLSNGGYHGKRLFRWGPSTYPFAYPIGDGVLLYR